MSKNKQTICFVTGTRADFGLLKPLLTEVEHSHLLHLQVIATGSHLSKAHGYTLSEIASSGFHVNEVVDIFENTGLKTGFTDEFVAQAVSIGLSKFTKAFMKLSPSAVVLLGDRYEILAAGLAAFFLKIPVVHLHGGEVTVGAIDDSIRHMLSKIARIHFVGTDVYRNRVIQLGEHPDYVFNYGGLGVDALAQVDYLSREELSKELGLTLQAPSFLVTFHPETYLSDEENQLHVESMLRAIKRFGKGVFIFTLPNADSGNDKIASTIMEFCDEYEFAHAFSSLGHQRYLSTLRVVNGVIGNSSSGLAEAPSFKVATINIGNRQQGRADASSVIHVKADESDIYKAILLSLSDDFRKQLENAMNPYGDGGASEKISRKLEQINFASLPPKAFHDLPFKLESE